ncbi:unnamed protein product [Cylicostephanus goldi]|uniref:Uncharacterized protein n=1 Tax=Cylicostephanus goldi TaxID=71465 RepID=A0A3P6T1B3_CYLGO|nr:unnamed protein product [Cylicostephanus goldi]
MNCEDVKSLFEEVKKIAPRLNIQKYSYPTKPSFYNGFKAIDVRDPLAKTLSELLRIADEAQFQNRLTELLSFLDQKGQ